MAVNYKAPFIYNQDYRMFGDQPSGNTTISNMGVTKLVSATTYTLQGPAYIGQTKTIYRAGSLSTAATNIASVSVVTSATGQVSFNSDGGTQVLAMRPTTAGTACDVAVTLIGEAATQWRIINAVPSISFNATMTKTRTDLVHRALRNLGALPQGQSPAAEDYASISDLVDALIAELEARDIIYIQNIDTYGLEDKYFMPLANILAWRAAPEFGAANDQALAALATQGQAYLEEMDRIDVHWNGRHRHTMKSDYPLGLSIVNNSTAF
jgi:hypothetical protein